MPSCQLTRWKKEIRPLDGQHTANHINCKCRAADDLQRHDPDDRRDLRAGRTPIQQSLTGGLAGDAGERGPLSESGLPALHPRPSGSLFAGNDGGIFTSSGCEGPVSSTAPHSGGGSSHRNPAGEENALRDPFGRHGACGLPHRAGDHRPGLPDTASGPEVPGRAPLLLHSDIR